MGLADSIEEQNKTELEIVKAENKQLKKELTEEKRECAEGWRRWKAILHRV